MRPIRYMDRLTKELKDEKVYGSFFIRLFYSPNYLSQLLAKLVLPLINRLPFFSMIYGALQKTAWSRLKIRHFIKKFCIDTSEFQDPLSSFKSFNDFFIRKLKPSSRPIHPDKRVAILPADARYLVAPQINESSDFFVKGKKVNLESLLKGSQLAQEYTQGTMVIARLAPVDYHRFHFPCDGFACTPQTVPGHYFSVNPMALKQRSGILTENKRMITRLETSHFDTVLYIEVGATNVGTIHQTFHFESFQIKGSEKGYFSFGGSCLILVFKPNVIQLDQDFIDASRKPVEVLGKLGQSLGKSLL